MIPDENTVARLERQVASLTNRVWQIEQRLGLTSPIETPRQQILPKSERHSGRNILWVLAGGFVLIYLWSHLSGIEIGALGLLLAALAAYFIVALSERKEQK